MSDAAHILIVDDDPEIRELLGRFLSTHGFRTSMAVDGEAMWQLLDQFAIDLIVLDIMLPGEDGLSLCRALRSKRRIPVIMLTAMGDDTDRIVGLEVGADDYLGKPFNPRELLARIRAVLRRAGDSSDKERGAAPKMLCFEGWELDLQRRELRRSNGTLVALTTGEYELLVVLTEHPQRVLSRDFLLEQTRGREAGPMDRSIDIQLSRLRRKVEGDASKPKLIKTIRGGGYLFSLPVERR